jgi:hypothetical protein
MKPSQMKDVHLASCQIETPFTVVDLAWKLARTLRRSGKFGSVIDFGAGDCRFARDHKFFDSYLGIERDPSRFESIRLPPNAKVELGDALLKEFKNYDLCIGNPPYVRHHHLDPHWRSEVRKEFAKFDLRLKATANAFVLFLAKALFSTKDDGLIVQVIPYEWVTRPSALELRKFIQDKGWAVTVLRFSADIFPNVLTTASITIIDKADKTGLWRFGVIDSDGAIKDVANPSGNDSEVLTYSPRSSKYFALRGLSPGGQEIFVLTEEERLFHGLHKNIDVMPAITSLRNVPLEENLLDEVRFNKYYVQKGRRCWLIQTQVPHISQALSQYILSVKDGWKKYSTCTTRSVWYQYRSHPIPDLLIASGFTGDSPKIVINEVNAVAVGAVYAIFATGQDFGLLRRKLTNFNFREKVVSHANNLKKIEVNQLNAVLGQI